MSKQETLRVDLIADNKKLKQGLQEGKQQMQSFGQSITKLAGVMGAAFSVTALLRFGNESAKLADTQLVSEQKLLVALGNREGVQQRLISQAQQLQKVTRFGDEATIEAQALLAIMGLTEGQIKKLIPLIQDMATGLGMDLVGATSLVGKSIASSTDALQRYFVTGLTGVNGTAERTEVLVKTLTERFGGQAEAMSELALGPSVKLSNAFGDLREKMGALLLLRLADDFKELTDTVNALSIILTSEGGFIGAWKDVNSVVRDSELYGLITGLNLKIPQQAFNTLQELIQRLGKEIEDLPEEPGWFEQGFKGIGMNSTPLSMPFIFTPLGGAHSALMEELKESLPETLDKFRGVPLEAIESLNAGLLDTTNLLGSVADSLKMSEPAWDAYAEKLAEVSVMMNETMRYAFIDLGTGIGELFGNIVTQTGNFGEQMAMIMADIAKQLGRTLIAMGAALFLLNPTKGALMIAKGVGLTAFGQITSNFAHESGSVGNERIQTVQIEGVTRGEDIYWSNRRASDRIGGIT